MKGGRRSPDSTDSDKDDSNDYSDESDSKEESDDNATIETRIMKAKHPLEKIRFISNKHLSPTQKAILCCMEINGGEASEADILRFLLRHWNFIKTINPRLPNNPPDTRVLHINLVVKKKGVYLFLQSKENPSVWYANTSDDAAPVPTHVRAKYETRSSYETRSTRKEMAQQTKEPEEQESESSKESVEEVQEEVTLFEDLVLDIVKQKPKGIMFKEIVSKSKDFEGSPGLFMSLPHKYRVKACLVTHRSNGVLYEILGRWSINPPAERITQKFEGIDVQNDPSKTTKASQAKNSGISCTLQQHWENLKEKKIYL